MKKYAYVAVLVAASFAVSSAFAAGDLANGATVVKVLTRKTSPAEAFTVETTGGTGACTNGSINFPATGSASTDDGMRSIALAAMLSGKQVRIYSYSTGTDCAKGEYIKIEN